MSSAVVGLIAFACFFGGAMLGIFLRSRLPESHQSADTQRIVNLGVGIIGTMAALVLGLLVASAKGSYDTQNNELTALGAKILLLDHGLALYGPEADGARDLLRRNVDSLVEQLWSNKDQSPENPSRAQPTPPTALYDAIQALSPQSEIQRTVKTQGLSMMAQIGEQRLLILQQKKSSVSKPLLEILIFALAINFSSFGLFAPRNATVIATLFLCAMASSGAIFVMMELYHPYGGFIQIPSATLQNVLTQLK